MSSYFPFHNFSLTDSVGKGFLPVLECCRSGSSLDPEVTGRAGCILYKIALRFDFWCLEDLDLYMYVFNVVSF